MIKAWVFSKLPEDCGLRWRSRVANLHLGSIWVVILTHSAKVSSDFREPPMRNWESHEPAESCWNLWMFHSTRIPSAVEPWTVKMQVRDFYNAMVADSILSFQWKQWWESETEDDFSMSCRLSSTLNLVLEVMVTTDLLQLASSS